MLAGKGFKEVYNVSGGIKAWQSKTAVGPQNLGMHLFEGDESAEVFLITAYSLEQGLQQFYGDMAEKAHDKTVRDLFEKLAAIEKSIWIRCLSGIGTWRVQTFQDQRLKTGSQRRPWRAD